MTRDDALTLLAGYEQHVPFLEGIAARFPEDGSEKKAMRWLGYAQGVAHALGYYSLDEIKAHSRDRVITPPVSAPTGNTLLKATLRERDKLRAERDAIRERTVAAEQEAARLRHEVQMVRDFVRRLALDDDSSPAAGLAEMLGTILAGGES